MYIEHARDTLTNRGKITIQIIIIIITVVD